ncbi:hypothetical protein RHDE110596_23420 [Prescottella defluvii]
MAAADDEPRDGADAGEQCGDAHQAGRGGGERERADQRGDRGGQESVGGDGAFDRAPREQGADGDDRFGAQAVVVGQPEREEHEATGPQCDVVGAHCAAEAGDHLAADDHPAQDGGEQRGQTHPGAGGGDLRHRGEDVVVPAERGFGDAEPAEVVGHVAGVLGGAGHGEQVAVVGGVGAEEVPADEGADDDAVDAGQLPPAGGQEAAGAAAVDAVEAVQCDERDGGREDGAEHRDEFDQGGAGREPGVDVHREAQAGHRLAVEVGEDADDLRAVVVEQRAGDGFAVVVRQAHEFCGGPGDVGVDPDLGALPGFDVGARCAGDDDVAVEDVDGLGGDAHEHRVDRGLLTLWGCGGQQDAAGLGEFGDGAARDRRRQRHRYLRHQRCFDVRGDRAVGPRHRRRGLGDRQERCREREQDTEQTGHDGDQPSVADIRVSGTGSRGRSAGFGTGRGGCHNVWHVCRW